MTLVYTDIPGTTSSHQHRINDLSLTVISPSNVTIYGDQGLLEETYRELNSAGVSVCSAP